MSPSSTSGGTNHLPGSHQPGEPGFLVVGKLRRPHGLHGELLMEVITDFPERLEPGGVVYYGEEHLPVTIRSLRWHGKAMLVAFDSIIDPETAGNLRNQWVYVRTDDRPPLQEGEFYHHEILGLRVYDEDDRMLGVVADILETGANDVYVIKPEIGKEFLIPAIESVVLAIDKAEGRMRVQLLPGLLPD